MSSNSSGNEKLDLVNTNRKKDGHLVNDSSSNQMKLKEDGDLRKVNNGSGIIGGLTDVGDQNKSNDSSAKKGDDREGLKEAEVEKKRIDSGSKRDDRKEETKEAEQQDKAKDISSEKQGEMEKILPDGIQSREEILPTRKESFHGEECDSSYSCTIEEKAVVACLRVPGNGMFLFTFSIYRQLLLVASFYINVNKEVAVVCSMVMHAFGILSFI